MYIFQLPDEPRGHWAYVPSVTVGLLDVGVSCSWMAAEMLLCLSWLEKTLLRSSKSGLARWKRRHCTGVFEFADLFVFFLCLCQARLAGGGGVMFSNLSVYSFVHLLPNLSTWSFENECFGFDASLGTGGSMGRSMKQSASKVERSEVKVTWGWR